jgi:hypothetical protein
VRTATCLPDQRWPIQFEIAGDRVWRYASHVRAPQ